MAKGDCGRTCTCRPLTFKGIWIKPCSSMMFKDCLTIGIIVSEIKRPKALPKFCDNSFILSATSVADRALIVSGGKLSSYKPFLIAILMSALTICDICASPDRGSGDKLGPAPPLAFEATGMMAPGTIEIVEGFNTPSSRAVKTPPMERDAPLSVSSVTLLSVFVSPNTLNAGPRP